VAVFCSIVLEFGDGGAPVSTPLEVVLVTDLVCWWSSTSVVVILFARNARLWMPPCSGSGGWFWFSELRRWLWFVLCVLVVFVGGGSDDIVGVF
jgi:hypothetical protein